MKDLSLLSQLIRQYQSRHNRLPLQIVVDPLALIVLAARQSVGPVWNGIPVVCQDFEKRKPQGAVNALGVMLDDEGLLALDLAVNLSASVEATPPQPSQPV